MSIENWNFYYFIFISKKPRAEFALETNSLGALLQSVGVGAAIATTAVMHPAHLINHKGVTPWIALFVAIKMNNSSDLDAAESGKALLIHPSHFVNSTFESHVNWPKEMIEKYDLDPSPKYLLLLPFLVHKDTAQPQRMTQILNSPDGQLSVYGFREFDDNNPEKLLAECAEMVEFHKNNSV